MSISNLERGVWPRSFVLWEMAYLFASCIIAYCFEYDEDEDYDLQRIMDDKDTETEKHRIVSAAETTCNLMNDPACKMSYYFSSDEEDFEVEKYPSIVEALPKNSNTMDLEMEKEDIVRTKMNGSTDQSRRIGEANIDG